jgi:hypothetical protein
MIGVVSTYSELQVQTFDDSLKCNSKYCNIAIQHLITCRHVVVRKFVPRLSGHEYKSG